MLFTEGPAVLVDMSNVCRSETLCPPDKRASFAAFARVYRALQTSQIDFGGILAVADRNLRHLFDTSDKKKYAQAKQNGMIIEAPVADDLLIPRAFGENSPDRGAVIVSKDSFADFRPDYPAIQGSTQRFLTWRVTDDGTVELVWRDMGVFTHNRISRKIEEDDFKANHLHQTGVRKTESRGVVGF